VTKLNRTGSGLIYSTYLGGSDRDSVGGIAVDSLRSDKCGRGKGRGEDDNEHENGTATANAYVTGTTVSADFPVTAGAFQTVFGGRSDAFVTKLNPTGSGLIYSTYLGGSDGEIGARIAVDAAGNAYVTGGTGSTNFPTTPRAFHAVFGGLGDAFVTKLNPLGSGLIYSTFLGGSSNEAGHGIAVDAAGNAYVTGSTGSTDFPTTAGAFQTDSAGSTDAFVTKVNPLGTGLVYSTYLGGSGVEFETDIALDSLSPDTCSRGEDETENKKGRCTANAYVTGITVSANFPVTAGAFQTVFGGGMDTFVAKIVFVIKHDR
jgi:hypothetical protein